MSEFKKMKFWFNNGEEALFQEVCDILKAQGCTTNFKKTIGSCGQGLCISVRASGMVTRETDEKRGWWNNKLSDYEEINIDWMRTKKSETIELGGNTYIKSELEEALKHIKPVGGALK